VLPSTILTGLGLVITVAPLTSAILGSIDPARAGIASAVNNAVARIAGLICIALLGVITSGVLDLPGFHRVATFTAILMAAGAIASFIGIRNPVHAPEESPAGESAAGESTGAEPASVEPADAETAAAPDTPDHSPVESPAETPATDAPATEG
jgi:hypothetical protein